MKMLASFIVFWVAIIGCNLYLGFRENKQTDAQILKAYQDGYDDGIKEGIRRITATKGQELPLPVSEEGKAKVNYLERKK